MNSFVAKKLGEVLAFSRIGAEMVDRGGQAATEAFGGATNVKDFIRALGEFGQNAQSAGDETTTTKADATTDKLRGMMEAYITDEWDNPVELLEWLSFFLGSAAAHWALVGGASKSLKDKDLETTAQSAVDFYNSQLMKIQTKLAEQGQNRVDSNG